MSIPRKKVVFPRFYVYILFRENGIPFYVGKGCGNRWMDHEKPSNRGKTRKDYIIRDMLFRGVEVPKVKVAENLTHDQANTYEILFIAAIGRTPEGPLTNLTEGGGGKQPSPESLAKRSAALLGRVITPEWREKMRQAKLGTKLSAEHRAKISAGGKGKLKPQTPEHRAALVEAFKNRIPTAKQLAALRHEKGVPLAQEHRAKIRAAQKGRPLTEEHKQALRDGWAARRARLAG